jgi:nicotinamide-nucleotide amidase
MFRRGLVARDPAEIAATLCLDGGLISGEMSRETAETMARAARDETGATHGLAALVEVVDGPDRIDFRGSIHLTIAAGDGIESRHWRIYGGRDWQGLLVTERIAFRAGVTERSMSAGGQKSLNHNWMRGRC